MPINVSFFHGGNLQMNAAGLPQTASFDAISEAMQLARRLLALAPMGFAILDNGQLKILAGMTNTPQAREMLANGAVLFND